MGDVVVERAQGVVDHRAVAGPDRARSRAPRPARAAGRASRGRRRAGRRDGPPRWCRGRARCRRSAPPAPPAARTTASRPCAPASPRRAPRGRRPRPRRRSPRPSAPRRYAGSRARTPQPIRSANCLAASVWSRWWWVSSTTADLAGRRRPRRRGGPRRAGPGRRRPSACAGLAQHPGVGAVEGHHVRVRGEHALRRARRTTPPAQLISALASQQRLEAAPGPTGSRPRRPPRPAG